MKEDKVLFVSVAVGNKRFSIVNDSWNKDFFRRSEVILKISTTMDDLIEQFDDTREKETY